MPLKDDIEALRRLRFDPRLANLGSYVPPLSLFRLFGMVRDELAHSRMLASLLDPRRHRNHELILRPFLHEIGLALDKANSPDAASVHRVSEAPMSRVAVRLELFRIDIVVEIDSPDGDMVLGIENKIDADEQPRQIARYQRALSRGYPNRTAVMVFLCPDARAPITASPSSKVPVAEIGYRSVVSAIKSVLDMVDLNSQDRLSLEETARHIEEDILSSSDNTELRSMVRELWEDHGRAFRLVERHKPCMADIQQKYEEILGEYFGNDATFSYYPNSREFREIRMQLCSWKKKGFPFILMFYLGPNSGLLGVRLLLSDNGHGDAQYSYSALQPKLKEWAERVNESVGPMVDETFAPILRWTYWRRILAEENFPPTAALNKQSFDEVCAQEAAERVITLVESLRPYVEKVDLDS